MPMRASITALDTVCPLIYPTVHRVEALIAGVRHLYQVADAVIKAYFSLARSIIRKETRRLLRIVSPTIIQLRGRWIGMPRC